MSQPILPNTYSFVLNQANNFIINDILRPPIQNMRFVRVIASNNNTLLSISCVRASYLASTTDAEPAQIDGLCKGSEKDWWEVNTPYIDTINAYIYTPSNPPADQIFVTLQFTDKLIF